jgi:hypothetical protein
MFIGIGMQVKSMVFCDYVTGFEVGYYLFNMEA